MTNLVLVIEFEWANVPLNDGSRDLGWNTTFRLFGPFPDASAARNYANAVPASQGVGGDEIRSLACAVTALPPNGQGDCFVISKRWPDTSLSPQVFGPFADELAAGEWIMSQIPDKFAPRQVPTATWTYGPQKP